MARKNDKISNIDFILREDPRRKLIFRFLPQQSSCHSFDDKPPTKPEEIYKVYFAYEIIDRWRWDEKADWKSEKVFEQPCDECSVIDEVSFVCSLLAEGKEVFEREDGGVLPLLNDTMMPMGMGTDWTILKRLIPVWNDNENWDWENEEENITYEAYYTFMLFNCGGKGYRFELKEDKMKAFGEYLNECCEYMLAHGDPI